MTDERPLRSLKRWLLAVELMLRAEEASARGAPADHTSAVILADTAAESTLALLASLPGSNVTGDRFAPLLRAAFQALDARKLDYPKTLAVSIQTNHDRRDAALHYGLEATESASAIDATRQLLRLLSVVAPEFPDLPPGAGVLSGVAAMVAAAQDVANQLRQADAAARAGRWTQAADAGARALDLAFIQSTPAFRRQATGMPRPGEPEDVRKMLAPLRDDVARLQAWVEPMALGLRPADYARMRATLGTRVVYADRREEIFRNPEDPSPADVTWALNILAEVIVRLWTSGVMYRGSIKEAYDAGVLSRRGR